MMLEENKTEYDKSHIIETEVERLSNKYKKEFLDCNDLIGIIGVGRDNIRALMRSEGFPSIRIGNRKVVSITSFVIWEMGKDYLTYTRFRGNM